MRRQQKSTEAALAGDVRWPVDYSYIEPSPWLANEYEFSPSASLSHFPALAQDRNTAVCQPVSSAKTCHIRAIPKSTSEGAITTTTKSGGAIFAICLSCADMIRTSSVEQWNSPDSVSMTRYRSFASSSGERRRVSLALILSFPLRGA